MTQQAPAFPHVDLKMLAKMPGGEFLFPPPQAIRPRTLSYLNLPFAIVLGYRFLCVDLHLPRKTTGPTPVVVYASGGGWRMAAGALGPWQYLLDEWYAVASLEYRLSGEVRYPVPLEYSIEWLTCAFASSRDVVLVSLPGAAQDRLFAHVPGTRPGRPGVPRRPGERCRAARAQA